MNPSNEASIRILGEMELQLNQEPQGNNLSYAVDETESTYGHIEDRIRHLEAVTSRALQRRRWQQGQTPLQITNITAGLAAATVEDEGSAHGGEINATSEEMMIDGNGTRKRDSIHLIAKALETITDSKKIVKGSESPFCCNICFEMAKDPVLTCCGHLFCWPCFYQLSYAYSDAKECPVCMGEVRDTSIIPIYGNGCVDSGCTVESDKTVIIIPPRPRAQRIEGTRRQLEGRRASSVSMERRIRRNRSMIGTMGVFEAADISSSVLTAERIFEDLEAYVSSYHRTDSAHQETSSPADSYMLSSIFSGTQSGSNSSIPSSLALIIQRETTDSAINSEAQTTNNLIDISSTNQSSLSSSRRTGDLTVSSIASRVSRESRRRLRRNDN